MAGVDPGASSITVAGTVPTYLPPPPIHVVVRQSELHANKLQFACVLLLSEKPHSCTFPLFHQVHTAWM